MIAWTIRLLFDPQQQQQQNRQPEQIRGVIGSVAATATWYLTLLTVNGMSTMLHVTLKFSDTENDKWAQYQPCVQRIRTTRTIRLKRPKEQRISLNGEKKTPKPDRPTNNIPFRGINFLFCNICFALVIAWASRWTQCNVDYEIRYNYNPVMQSTQNANCVLFLLARSIWTGEQKEMQFHL